MLSVEWQSPKAAYAWKWFAAFVVCWTDRDLPLFSPTQFAPSCRKSKSFLIQRNHKPGLFYNDTVHSKYVLCSDVQLNCTRGNINNLAWSDRTCAFLCRRETQNPFQVHFCSITRKELLFEVAFPQGQKISASLLHPVICYSKWIWMV